MYGKQSQYSETSLQRTNFVSPLAMVKTTLTKVSDTQRLHKCNIIMTTLNIFFIELLNKSITSRFQYNGNCFTKIFVAHLCGEEEENNIITGTTMLT